MMEGCGQEISHLHFELLHVLGLSSAQVVDRICASVLIGLVKV